MKNDRWLLYTGIGALIIVFAVVIFGPALMEDRRTDRNDNYRLTENNTNEFDMYPYNENDMNDYQYPITNDRNNDNKILYNDRDYKYYRVNVNEGTDFYTNDFGDMINDNYELVGFTPYENMYDNNDPYYFRTTDYATEISDYQNQYVTRVRDEGLYDDDYYNELDRTGFRTGSFIIRTKGDINDFTTRYPDWNIENIDIMDNLRTSSNY